MNIEGDGLAVQEDDDDIYAAAVDVVSEQFLDVVRVEPVYYCVVLISWARLTKNCQSLQTAYDSDHQLLAAQCGYEAEAALFEHAASQSSRIPLRAQFSFNDYAVYYPSAAQPLRIVTQVFCLFICVCGQFFDSISCRNRCQTTSTPIKTVRSRRRANSNFWAA